VGAGGVWGGAWPLGGCGGGVFWLAAGVGGGGGWRVWLAARRRGGRAKATAAAAVWAGRFDDFDCVGRAKARARPTWWKAVRMLQILTIILRQRARAGEEHGRRARTEDVSPSRHLTSERGWKGEVRQSATPYETTAACDGRARGIASIKVLGPMSVARVCALRGGGGDKSHSAPKTEQRRACAPFAVARAKGEKQTGKRPTRVHTQDRDALVIETPDARHQTRAALLSMHTANHPTPQEQFKQTSICHEATKSEERDALTRAVSHLHPQDGQGRVARRRRGQRGIARRETGRRRKTMQYQRRRQPLLRLPPAPLLRQQARGARASRGLSE